MGKRVCALVGWEYGTCKSGGRAGARAVAGCDTKDRMLRREGRQRDVPQKSWQGDVPRKCGTCLQIQQDGMKWCGMVEGGRWSSMGQGEVSSQKRGGVQLAHLRELCILELLGLTGGPWLEACEDEGQMPIQPGTRAEFVAVLHVCLTRPCARLAPNPLQAEVNRTFQFTGLDSGSFYPFLVYTTVATAIASVFMIVPWIIAPQRIDLDKASAYECGFDAFGEARQTFSVSFYLVSIMYLLFDIEICYLLPYVLSHASAQMYWTMSMFLALLVVGFVYEWGVGALEWRD
eukprot:355183-Chlamydomonas_euryale.AAC.2